MNDAGEITCGLALEMFGIARTDLVRIQVSVPQTYASDVPPGSMAQVTVREIPGRTFTGTVALRAWPAGVQDMPPPLRTWQRLALVLYSALVGLAGGVVLCAVLLRA